LPECQFRRHAPTAAPVSSSEDVKEKNGGVAATQETTITGANDNAVAKRSFIQDLRLTSGTYAQASMLKLLGEIFIHLLNPAVIWIQLVSTILIVRPPLPLPHPLQLLTDV
jgi:hypothetical protein